MFLFKFCFYGTALGRFSQCFFLISHCRLTTVADIFTQPPPPPLPQPIKKLPTALYLENETSSFPQIKKSYVI